ncbi:MAG: hypothetical protein ACI8RZ_000519 [Myxococcota bacterium]|jgi:hypothetical protein
MRQLLMMAAASGVALGLADTLIRLTPLYGGGLHWHAILIAFVIMPALIIALTRRLKEGAAPLLAAVALSAGHFIGLISSDVLIRGHLWEDLLIVPLMTLPVLLLVATIVRLKTRKATAPAQVTESMMPTFEQARERARERRARQKQ